MQLRENVDRRMSVPEGTVRTRTITWEDPAIGAEAARTMSGLMYLRAVQAGEFPAPPIAHLIGMELVEIEEGRAVFAVEPAEYHYNPIGSVHGGLACTLLDSAMGCAVHTMLPAGTGYTTLELKVNLIRPLTRETGRVLCEGTIIHVGGRIATAEARIMDEAGALFAHATTTCMIFRGSQP
jgi:uncharacterized protein (TIGR00369 family)